MTNEEKVLLCLRNETVPRKSDYIEETLGLDKEDVLSSLSLLYAKRAVVKICVFSATGHYADTNSCSDYWACSKSAWKITDRWEDVE